ncbi:hypothetical protein [Runella zeae]|uniref:hypothetical protein n=1 Tax=Runella zeae TaxID=94255 RepID=UPI00042A79E8|nr:hypothetical protein [Runella zeae]
MAFILIDENDLKLLSNFLDKVHSYENKPFSEIEEKEKNPLKQFIKIAENLLTYGEELDIKGRKRDYKSIKEELINLLRDKEIATYHPFIRDNHTFKELIISYTQYTTEKDLGQLLNKKISEMTGKDLIKLLKLIGVEISKNN